MVGSITIVDENFTTLFCDIIAFSPFLRTSILHSANTADDVHLFEQTESIRNPCYLSDDFFVVEVKYI